MWTNRPCILNSARFASLDNVSPDIVLGYTTSAGFAVSSVVSVLFVCGGELAAVAGVAGGI